MVGDGARVGRSGLSAPIPFAPSTQAIQPKISFTRNKGRNQDKLTMKALGFVINLIGGGMVGGFAVHGGIVGAFGALFGMCLTMGGMTLITLSDTR